METWCANDASMGNSWDQEEEVEIGMWSNNQQDNRSNDQNTWNYKNKNSYKVCLHHTLSSLSFFLMHDSFPFEKLWLISGSHTSCFCS